MALINGLSIYLSNRQGGLSAEQILVNAFVTRVKGDGGTVESKSCLTTDLEFLNQNP